MSPHFPVFALCCCIIILQWVTCWESGGGVREGSLITPGEEGRGGLWLSLSHVPLSHPSCTWYRGGERQHEAPHSFRLLHETPRPDTQFTFSGLRCQLQLFASRTSVNRCITDGNGAALQLATINVSTWILINLQNSIYPRYYTCCYRESYESSP